MSAKRSDDGSRTPEGSPEESGAGGEPGEARTWRASLPFLIALGVVVAVIAVVVLSNLLRPTEERISEDAKVQYVVNDMYSARNALNYEMFRGAHCERDVNAEGFPTAREFADANRARREAQGQLVIPEMDVQVTGDRAAVTVHVHRENAEQNTTTEDVALVKKGDEWKVCSV